MNDSELKYRLGFAFLQKLCREEKENFVISPLSLGTALAMLTAGLRGGTKTELLKLFGTTNENKLHYVFCDILTRKDLPLKMANKCLAAQDIKIHQQFDFILRTRYKSEIECVNFGENAKDLEAHLNAWVAKKTGDMIPELLSEGALCGDAILVLLNAIYFKGSWLREFRPVPELMSFKLRNGQTVQRSFVTETSRFFRYGETDHLRLVTIPYNEAGFYMLVAIPKDENENIDEVLASIQIQDLIRAVESPRGNSEVTLTMPIFKIEYRFNRTQELLQELGVNEIFVPGVGDFGNLSKNKERGLCVSAIIQKAVIEVDEKGTAASCATPITVSMSSKRLHGVELNRPFCFLVMSSSNMVCLAGVCADPQAK